MVGSRTTQWRAFALAATLSTAALRAQEGAPPPQEAEPPAREEARAPRAPEGDWIINLPSADVPRAGTLTLLFTHRFSERLQDSDVRSLFSFDSGADIGIGLAYSPWTNLEVSIDRSSSLDVYELAAKYRFFARGPVAAALRAGGDWRTERGLSGVAGYSRSGFFAQGILALSFGSRARLTVVPTYVSQTSGQPFVTPRAAYKDVFNVPIAASVALTRTVNIQGEVIPARSRVDSRGVGWIAAIEKTLLRHRFSFTVGNVRETTADQYVAPSFAGFPPRDIYLGFNLTRQWNMR